MSSHKPRPDNPDRKDAIAQQMMTQTYHQMVDERLLPRLHVPEVVGMLYFSNFLENMLPEHYRDWVRMTMMIHLTAFYDQEFTENDLEYLRASPEHLTFFKTMHKLIERHVPEEGKSEKGKKEAFEKMDYLKKQGINLDQMEKFKKDIESIRINKPK